MSDVESCDDEYIIGFVEKNNKFHNLQGFDQMR